MRKSKNLFRSIIILMLVVVTLITGCIVPVSGADKNSRYEVLDQKSYDIAVVFDNSGSMYNTDDRWCKAKYAMEIFASMLDYSNGDRLTIYPMWAVTTTEDTSGEGSWDPIVIDSIDKIDRIHYMYTVYPADPNVSVGTPFEPVTEAYTALAGNTKDNVDKWLIVLSDGKFNQNERYKDAGVDIKSEFDKMASEDIKVQYLGFANAAQITSGNPNFHSLKSSDTGLRNDLVGICNKIFQRSELSGDKLSDDKLTLEISMRKIIVFVQGEDAKINSLTQDGKEISMISNSKQRKYSENKTNVHPDAPVDNTLFGQVVTFDACQEGICTLDYTLGNNGKVQVFYEPDVDVTLSLIDSDGQEVDPQKGEIIPGDYTVKYGLVDSKTGKDVTTSPLMDPVKLKAVVTTSDGKTTEVGNGGTVNLKADKNTKIVVEGTYLDKYKITSEGSGKFPDFFKIAVPKVNLKVKTQVQQGESWYKTGDHKNWKPIKATLTIDGKPLTSEQMKAVDIKVNFSKDIAYNIEKVDDKSLCYIHIGYNENGDYKQPSTGGYKVTVTATYTDEYKKETTAKSSDDFEVQHYDKFWRWLLWIVIIAGIILLIVFILTRKALPKSMYLKLQGDLVDIDISDGNVELASVMYPGTLSCVAKRNSMLFQKFGSGASIKVSEPVPSYDVISYKIGNKAEYTRVDGVFVDSKGSPFSETIVRHGTRITIERKDRPTIEGKISMNGK